jgi:hypothetical protein
MPAGWTQQQNAEARTSTGILLMFCQWHADRHGFFWLEMRLRAAVMPAIF